MARWETGHWLTEGTPANVGYLSYLSYLSTSDEGSFECPFEKGTSAYHDFWMGADEAHFSFRRPPVITSVPVGHDHPEWV